jgi:hypothetical protein
MVAAIHAHLGNVPAAVTCLDQVMSVPSQYTSEWVEEDPLMLPIRNHPLFQGLMERHRGRIF